MAQFKSKTNERLRVSALLDVSPDNLFKCIYLNMLWYNNLNKLLHYLHVLSVSLVLFYVHYFESPI